MKRSSDVYSVIYRGREAKFFVANPADLIQANFVKGHFFDIDELENFSRYIQPASTILDIGANVGNHTVFFSQHSGAKKVVPFEVNPDAVKLLKKNVELNRLDNVDLRHLGTGLGYQTGRIFMLHSRENNLGATAFTSRHSQQQQTGFPIEALDDLWDFGDKADFIKIDVEGMEFEVLQGAQKLIDRDRPAIFIENFGFNAGVKLLLWLAAHHYRIEKTFGPNYLLLPLPVEEHYSEDCRQRLAGLNLQRLQAADASVEQPLLEMYQGFRDDPHLGYAFAELFRKLECYDSAWQALRRAITMVKRPYVALYQSEAEIARRRQDSRGEIAGLEKAAVLTSHDAVIIQRLAELKGNAGRYRETYYQTRTFVAANPDCALGHHLLSVAAERLGLMEDALRHARQAVALNSPDAANLMVRLADLTRTQGSPKEALSVVERAFKLGQHSDWARQVKKAILKALKKRPAVRRKTSAVC